jgi:hypothetical protein
MVNTNEEKRRKQRAWLVLGIVLFVGSFQQVYLKWLYPVFGYYGFENSTPAMSYLLLAWCLSVVPALWMPIRLNRPSQLIYWVLYLTVFIPSMFVPLYVGLQNARDVADERLDAWGLYQARDVRVDQLSYGKQRALEIVLALSRKPRR